MSASIAERDWKIFRELHGAALERMCARQVEALRKKLDEPDSALDKFWDAHELLHKSAKEVRDAFDDMRRSTAWLQITRIRSLGLWTEEELNQFSPELLRETTPYR